MEPIYSLYLVHRWYDFVAKCIGISRLAVGNLQAEQGFCGMAQEGRQVCEQMDKLKKYWYAEGISWPIEWQSMANTEGFLVQHLRWQYLYLGTACNRSLTKMQVPVAKICKRRAQCAHSQKHAIRRVRCACFANCCICCNMLHIAAFAAYCKILQQMQDTAAYAPYSKMLRICSIL